MKVHDPYEGEDPAELPAYRMKDVAYYLNIPKSTLRSWSFGQDYRTKTGKHRFRPLIRPADPDRSLLSFQNLVEAHVLTALRRQHFVPLPVIRIALQGILKRNPTSRHPLADSQFATVGKELFISIAEDYDTKQEDVLEAIRWELAPAA